MLSNSSGYSADCLISGLHNLFEAPFIDFYFQALDFYSGSLELTFHKHVLEVTIDFGSFNSFYCLSLCLDF